MISGEYEQTDLVLVMEINNGVLNADSASIRLLELIEMRGMGLAA